MDQEPEVGSHASSSGQLEAFGQSAVNTLSG